MVSQECRRTASEVKQVNVMAPELVVSQWDGGRASRLRARGKVMTASRARLPRLGRWWSTGQPDNAAGEGDFYLVA